MYFVVQSGQSFIYWNIFPVQLVSDDLKFVDIPDFFLNFGGNQVYPYKINNVT